MGTDIHGVWQKRTGDKWEDVPSEYTQDRHYLLFAFLGNVRNGFGFAGVPTHTAITPLSDCRGYPEGFPVVDDIHTVASPELIYPRRRQWQEDNDLWMGDHSHSWVSADEVLGADMQKILRTGIVSIDMFKKWDGASPPDSWSGGITGPKIMVSEASEITPQTTHVRIEWFEDTTESLSYFVDEARRLKDLHGDVRFVFGFDS